MKTILPLIGLTLLCLTSTAQQWGTNTTGTTYYASSTSYKVGIGLGSSTAASEKLHVVGNMLATGNIIGGGTFQSVSGADLIFRTNTTTRFTILNSNGNFGIGTVIPSELLHVNGNIRGSKVIASQIEAPTSALIVKAVSAGYIDFQTSNLSRIFIKDNGQVGIGTSIPGEMLHVNGSIRGNINGAIRISSGNGTVDVGAMDGLYGHIQTDRPAFLINKKLFVNEGIISSYDESLSLQAAGVTGLTIQQTTGNVGIGTADPKGYRLAVAGKLVAEEMVVKFQGNWPDYVFAPGYTIRPLTEVEAYIKTHQHLPEVPAAETIASEGIALGEMDAILLKKIEELTLYVIDVKNENQKLKEEVEQLKSTKRKKNKKK